MAVSILEALQGIMESWLEGGDTTFTKWCIAMDSGANMHDGGFVGICYFAQIIHLVVRDDLGLEERASVSHSAIQEVPVGGRKVSSLFHQSVKGARCSGRSRHMQGSSSTTFSRTLPPGRTQST